MTGTTMSEGEDVHVTAAASVRAKSHFGRWVFSMAAVLVIPDVAKQSFKLRPVLTKLHVILP